MGGTKEVFALAAKRQRNRGKRRRREENFRGSGRKKDTEGDFLSGTHNLFSLLFFFFACGRRGSSARVLLCLLTKLNEKFCAVALSPLPHPRHANRKKSLLLVPTSTEGGDCVSFTFVSLIVFFFTLGGLKKLRLRLMLSISPSLK